MKILIAHNAYQHRGGEDAVMEAEAALLTNYGHEVHVYSRHNDEIKTMPGVLAAASTVWSSRTVREIDQICKHFSPDVIHAHNSFPLISSSLYWAASHRKIPVVQTLHNFRLICPQAMLLRDGKICEDCVGKTPWRAVVRKCYRNSLAQSAVAVCTTGVHRAIGTYRHKVTRYIALNRFSKDKFIAGGLPAERISIKPNFVARRPAPSDGEARQGGIFVGRLAPEKGLDTLIDAVNRLGQAPLKIAGTGPMEPRIRQLFGNAYLGYLSALEITALLHEAQYLIAPSTCYETFGMVVIEAFSCGTPVIASRHGGLGELVKDGITGLLFEPSNPADLAAKIAWAQAHPHAMRRMGLAARAEYEKKYTPERNYRMLINIYEDAIAAQEKFCYAT